MCVSGVLALGLVVLAFMVPAPYVIESPGPTFNTLGSNGGKPVIDIVGHESYPAKGNLDLVTVYVNGGPQGQVNLLSAYRAWLDKTQSVVPEELLYPAGTTSQEVSDQNAAEMTSSQENATAAALTQLKIPYTTTLSIYAIPQGSAASGKLEAKDVLTSIDGKPITDLQVIKDALAQGAGKPVTIDFTRDGVAKSTSITPQAGSNNTYLLGVQIMPKYTFPFKVNIALSNVGGPSAGMMFTLGIIDTLTPGDLTGGKHIAGTGTIDPTGTVGAIGGIAQKMVGARNSGATVFLAPSANCGDVLGHVPDGLQVVKVDTLAQAYNDVSLIGSGKDTSSLPTCSAK
ncbi:MAG: PDZ domain-containing protein [Acidobacteria bacterium]|nr:PDZ domain-containing protein [Acidobacteriota bacterium]